MLSEAEAIKVLRKHHGNLTSALNIMLGVSVSDEKRHAFSQEAGALMYP
jgi:hypothetical protein